MNVSLAEFVLICETLARSQHPKSCYQRCERLFFYQNYYYNNGCSIILLSVSSVATPFSKCAVLKPVTLQKRAQVIGHMIPSRAALIWDTTLLSLVCFTLVTCLQLYANSQHQSSSPIQIHNFRWPATERLWTFKVLGNIQLRHSKQFQWPKFKKHLSWRE